MDLLSTGWEGADTAIGGGLTHGGLHEWLGIESITAPGEIPRRSRSLEFSRALWRPPLCVLIHLAWKALEGDAAKRWTVWIGGRCFPYPAALLRGPDKDRSLLAHSLFVSPRTPADRLWTMDLALRCPAVRMVIGDGSDFDMAATRRIQLLAKKYATLALLARPPGEQTELSAAQTRWLVRQEPSIHASRSGLADPQWRVELLRCKGVHFQSAQDVWNLEWDRATCTLRLSAPVAHSTAEAQAESGPGRGLATLDRRLA